MFWKRVDTISAPALPELRSRGKMPCMRMQQHYALHACPVDLLPGCRKIKDGEFGVALHVGENE